MQTKCKKIRISEQTDGGVLSFKNCIYLRIKAVLRISSINSAKKAWITALLV